MRSTIICLVLLLLISPVSRAQLGALRCDNVDERINEHMKASQEHFAEANRMAQSIKDQTIANGTLEVLDILNPVIVSPGDLAETGMWAVCKSVVGKTVGGGIELTSMALQIAVAIGNTETGSVQRMIESRRKFGYERLEKARELLRWKRDNCPCLEETPPADNTPDPTPAPEPEPAPEEPDGEGVSTSSGSGSGPKDSNDDATASDDQVGTGPTVFEGGGMTVTVIGSDRVRVDVACDAEDKRVQMRTTGTWSTKSIGEDSTVIEGLRVGASYDFRSRCDRLLRESLQFTMPEHR